MTDPTEITVITVDPEPVVTGIGLLDPPQDPVPVAIAAAGPPDPTEATVVSLSGFPVSGAPGAVQLTDAPTIVTDASQGRLFEVTLGGNRALANPVNLAPDQKLTWRIVQDATGGRTLTLGSIFNINMVATGPIVLSTAGHAVDYLGGIYRVATDQIDVLAFSPGF